MKYDCRESELERVRRNRDAFAREARELREEVEHQRTTVIADLMTEVERLSGDIERLRADGMQLAKVGEELAMGCRSYADKLAKARAALEWYGDKSNWLAGSDDWSRTDNDRGERARQALKEIR